MEQNILWLATWMLSRFTCCPLQPCCSLSLQQALESLSATWTAKKGKRHLLQTHAQQKREGNWNNRPLSIMFRVNLKQRSDNTRAWMQILFMCVSSNLSPQYNACVFHLNYCPTQIGILLLPIVLLPHPIKLLPIILRSPPPPCALLNTKGLNLALFNTQGWLDTKG